MGIRIPNKAKMLIAATLGALIYAIGINMFIVPHKLLSGGIMGIAMIIYYLTGVPIGLANFILNIPILLVALKWLGKWFVFVAVYGAVVCSALVDQMHFIVAYQLTQSPIIGAMGGGIVTGIGMGIVYRYGATCGGIDPLGQIVRKYWGLQIASVVLAMNMVILLASAFIFNVEIALITLLSSYISAQIGNKVVLGFQQQKAAYIVSYKSEEISEHIMEELGRGVTLLHGEGAYTHESKKVVFAVIGLMQIVKLKNVVNEIDPHAFLLITDAAEVTGGFIKRKIPAPVLVAVDELEDTLKENSHIANIEVDKESWEKKSL